MDTSFCKNNVNGVLDKPYDQDKLLKKIYVSKKHGVNTAMSMESYVNGRFR